MFEDIKKAQRKRKKKKMIAQRAKAEQAHAAQRNKAKASARPNIPGSVQERSNIAEKNVPVKGKQEVTSKNVVEAKKEVPVNNGTQGTQSVQKSNINVTDTKSNVHKVKKSGNKAVSRKKVNVKKAVRQSKTASKPHESQGYQERLLQHKKDVIRKGFVTAGVALGVLVVIGFFMEKGSYHNYRILQTSEQEDIISTSYVEMDGKILRYSPDGAALVDSKLQTHWSELYDMQNPVADVCGDSAVIADQDGTSIKIFNKNGLTGSVTTSYNIVKVHVSESGLVAAILDGGDETWINYYATDGSLIAENQTKIEDPGYPMDVAVSKDGMVMMIAYQFVDGGDTTSYVAFYNFGDVGQNEDDRIVSGYTYNGVVVPQIEYMDSNRSVAFRDDGFTIYKGKQIPKESETIEVEDEIISTFHDDDMIGLVFKSGDKDKPYAMRVYSMSGALKFEKNFNIPYTTIKVSGDHIIMYNSSQMCVLNSRGVEKYSGTIDGTIKNLFKIGWNRYLLVLDTGVNVIKFS